jgi:hypothetical protein
LWAGPGGINTPEGPTVVDGWHCRLAKTEDNRWFLADCFDWVWECYSRNLSIWLHSWPTIAEPPKLYGPHAPVIVSKTSDGYACTPDNLRRSIGCPRRTPIQLRLTTHTSINKGVTTILQHLLQNFTSECGRITTMNL